MKRLAETYPWPRSVGWLVITVLLIGCSSRENNPPPPNNMDVVTPSGDYVGHLKPDPNILASIDPDLPQVDPVIWVVDGNQVLHQEQELSLHLFRLDFNEKVLISIDMLPYVLMTEDSRQVVIHRGEPPAGYSNSAISQGERCLPVYLCMNSDCPRIAEVENAALFPHDPTSGQPDCPFCEGQHEAMLFQTPQHNGLLFLMEQQSR